MFENIRSYFVNNVLANYKEFRKQITSKETGLDTDIRFALNAASPLYHMREHMPKKYQKTRSKIAEECLEYDLLGDIVNASKHKELNRNNPKLKKASSIKETLISTEYEDEEGKYFDIEKKVYAELQDGKEIDLESILLTVINYWIEELKKLDISFKKFTPIVKKIPPPRSSQSGASRLDMNAIKGEKFELRVRFRRYDYEKEEFIPRDISDSNVRMNFYKPNFKASVLFTNENTGESHEVSFPITAEQHEKLENIEDEELKELYINKILKESDIFKEGLNKIFGNK